jgi:predicted lysophospholipase L1 biosynthesis ABC-type transport system permease subunit
MTAPRNRSIEFALVGGAAGLLASFCAWVFLGMVTGVIMMCAWAPEWWVRTYLALAVSVPAGGTWGAVRARRGYLRRQR